MDHQLGSTAARSVTVATVKASRDEPLRRLGLMTWTDLRSQPAPVLVVPIGSLEQHGPHLPLATDTIIAERMARHLCEQRRVTILSPALAITASGEHNGFAGTLSIGTEATTTAVVELVRSADWSAGVVLVNAHGGNADALSAALATLRNEGRNVLAWWPSVDDGDLHAGATETSLMLAIAPDQVRLGDAVDGPTPTTVELRQHGVARLSASGVLGAATQASESLGHQLLARLDRDLVDTFDHWYPT